MRRALILGVLAGATACTDTPVQVALRALSSSGPVSFVCLAGPGGGAADVALPLDECTSGRVGEEADFSIPHIYALVTQPNNGEIAVVDLTAEDEPVIDQDPRVPGAGFLPVGAALTDIVSTPGGMASFAAAGEVSYEGIYALPSDMIRGGSPRLTSWPACALPAAPGQMALVLDPADADGAVRPSCDATYGEAEGEVICLRDEEFAKKAEERNAVAHCHGDLANDARAVGKPGRYKLVVTLPSLGGVAVIDAQSILDGDAGQRLPCDIERWVALEVAPPPLPETPPPSPSATCVPPETGGDLFASAYVPVPAGITLDDHTLYVADRGAPVIHRIELPTVCEPREVTPLVARSAEDPDRVVHTSRVAVGPLTLDLKKYLYAVDVEDGSTMVFDVSDSGGSPLPLERENAVLNPFQPVDRIRFGAAPRDVVVVQHQNDEVDDDTGSTLPVRCDPDPTSNGPGTAYRTSEAYDSGAAPGKLRGVFSFSMLQSGDMVVIDVDDYDAPCRGPIDETTLAGCVPPLAEDLARSGEFTCNVVQPHQPRAATFLGANIEGKVRNQPGLRTYPLLFDADGAALQLADEDQDTETNVPRMVSSVAGQVVVKDTLEEVDEQGRSVDDPNDHVLFMNLEDARAHILDQDWTATYEGGLPGFGDRFGELVETSTGFELRDVQSNFCDRGVVSATKLYEEAIEAGTPEAEASEVAFYFADYVQIASETPAEADPYWSGQSECSFLSCNTDFGTVEAPLDTRDLAILEATQDTLQLERRGPEADSPVKCCFPGVVEFNVRGGDQWVVLGSAVGLLHTMVADDIGRCRPSCDANLGRLNARAFSTPVGADLIPFGNPFFRFGIIADAPERDMQFQWSTVGAFQPLALSVVTNDPDVQPTSIRLLSATGELVVSDGSLQGITLLDLNSLIITRQVN
jgi:hypothetical protein